jgi:hypothetical protein
VINSVRLPVQLACNPRATSVSAGPCLPIGKPHACMRAARLPHGIGSSQGHDTVLVGSSPSRNSPRPASVALRPSAILQHSREPIATNDMLAESNQWVTGICRFGGNSWVADTEMALLLSQLDRPRNAEMGRYLRDRWQKNLGGYAGTPENPGRPQILRHRSPSGAARHAFSIESDRRRPADVPAMTQRRPWSAFRIAGAGAVPCARGLAGGHLAACHG